MKPETEQRYRTATEAKFGPIEDAQWARLLGRFNEKRRARYLLNRAVRVGTIIPHGCAIDKCWRTPTEGHHPDYSKPFSIVWLCRQHHAAEHASLRRMSPKDRQDRNDALVRFSERTYRDSILSFVGDFIDLEMLINEQDAPRGEFEDYIKSKETFIEYDEEYLRKNAAPIVPKTHTQCPHCHGTGLIPWFGRALATISGTH